MLKIRWRFAKLLLGLAAVSAPPAGAGWRAEGPFEGNVNHLAFAPTRPETVYAATSGGGVWRSDDGGATWSLPGDEMTSRDVQWVMGDPSDPAVAWAGTDSDGRHSALWRTTDRGATWKPVADSYLGGRVQATGRPIAFVPTQPKTIYVPSSNLHYRSDDGGKSWRDFRVPNQDAYAIAVHPTDPKIVYAGGRGETQNVSRSTDGGKTWRQIGFGLGKNSLARLRFDPGEPTTLYATGGTFTNVFKSTDQGESWTALALPVGGTSDLFDFVIDPRNGEILWAATEDGLLKSTDGGASWARSDRGTGRYLVKSVAIDPRDSSHLVAGAGGDGIFVSRDGGASWSPSSTGLAAGWVEKLWGDPRSATLFAQTAIALYRGDGASWTEVTAPFTSGDKPELDGIHFDVASPQTIFAFDTSSSWRSTDGGRRFQAVEQKEPSLRDLMKGNLDAVQFASLAQERGDAKVLYAGSWSNRMPGGAVYKSVDAGKKWTPSGSGLPTEQVGLLRAGAKGTVFALVSDNGLYRTTNGGGSWTASPLAVEPRDVHDVVVHPGNPSELYAATGKGLFRSADSGASWARVGAASGLEGDDVEAVVIDPASGAVYAGSFHGVFRSADAGATWRSMKDGMPNTDVRALAISGSPPRLWAGTAGGSAWSTELP